MLESMHRHRVNTDLSFQDANLIMGRTPKFLTPQLPSHQSYFFDSALPISLFTSATFESPADCCHANLNSNPLNGYFRWLFMAAIRRSVRFTAAPTTSLCSQGRQWLRPGNSKEMMKPLRAEAVRSNICPCICPALFSTYGADNCDYGRTAKARRNLYISVPISFSSGDWREGKQLKTSSAFPPSPFHICRQAADSISKLWSKKKHHF